MVFSKNSSRTRPPRLRKRKILLILVIYDESIFSANNGKRRIWKEKRKSLLQLKRKRKIIMVSEFLIPIRKLRVPNFMSNHQFLQDKD